MPSRKISRRQLLLSCAEPGTGDGCDPRLDRPDAAGKVRNRKALQLCAQVECTLVSAFADCGDDFLRDLFVESVTPLPNASRLLVTVIPTVPIDAAVILEHLERARGKLRSEAVAAIHRRRAPDLLFRVREPGR